MPEPNVRIVDGNAVVAGERQFEPRAQSRTVDRGDDRHSGPLEVAKNAFELLGKFEKGLWVGGPVQVLQITPGQEGSLRRGDDHPPQGPAGLFLLQMLQHRRKGRTDLVVDDVDVAPLHVER